MNGAADSANPPARVFGLLLAAGRSRRMGKTKQLLDWPGPRGRSTVVAAAFDSLAPFCGRMLVTIGHDASDVQAALQGRAFDAIPCDADADMFASIKAGLLFARRIDPGGAVMLLPADQPGILPSTVQVVLAAGVSCPHCAIMPEYRGRGGHPALLPPNAMSIILADSGECGLRGLWERRPELRTRTPVEDPACVRDLDTPEDYARAASLE